MLHRHNIVIALIVVGIHAALWGFLKDGEAPIAQPKLDERPEAMVVALIKPKLVQESSSLHFPPVEPIALSANAIIDPDLPALEISRPVKLTAGVGTLAAGPGSQELPDTKPFAVRAGLAAGQGATVVLRIEVKDDNELGRISVEVSGGSAEIDAAAIAYARSMSWVGAVINGNPVTMQVRYAVHLQT
jgi:TonB family protein